MEIAAINIADVDGLADKLADEILSSQPSHDHLVEIAEKYSVTFSILRGGEWRQYGHYQS